MSDVVIQDPPVKMMRLYKLPSGSGKYVFGSLLGPDGKPKYPSLNGKVISFIAGRYMTDDAREIEELDDQISRGYTNIIIDPREKEVDSRANDPIFRLRESIRMEERKRILAEMAAASDPSRDMGSYEQGALNPTSTTTIAVTAAGGDGSASGVKAQLAALAAKASGG